MLVVVVVVILSIMLLPVAGEANDPIPSSIPFPYNNKSLASKHGGDQHNFVPTNMHCFKILAPPCWHVLEIEKCLHKFLKECAD